MKFLCFTVRNWVLYYWHFKLMHYFRVSGTVKRAIKTEVVWTSSLLVWVLHIWDDTFTPAWNRATDCVAHSIVAALAVTFVHNIKYRFWLGQHLLLEAPFMHSFFNKMQCKKCVCWIICSFDFLWLLQDGLVETLRRTRLKFVHCFLPHHNAALGDSARSGTLKSNSSLTGSNMPDDLLINVPLLRSQVNMWVTSDLFLLYNSSSECG
jgi:hypothetical protein